MSTDRLNVLLYNKQVGVLENSSGGPVFVYDGEWLASARAGSGHALSISMPMTAREHGPKVVSPFIAGLLPDSQLHRSRLAEEFGLERGAVSDFEFLRRIGRDCAGAVVFADPSDPYEEVRKPPAIQKLTEPELAEMLRSLPSRPLMDDPELGTRLSLAGVHDKMAVVVAGGAVALPLHGFPSSHILKIDIPGLKDSARTEHFCLRLAEACGLRVPKSSLHQVEDITYMRVARYDRRWQVRENGAAVLLRAHQEDLCQALCVHPELKYEVDGGPSWKSFAELMKLMERPAVDQAGMLDRAAFQYLVGNPDAHGKNYAIRYSSSGTMALSPLYDVNNQAAFAKNYSQIRPRMAMSIGRDRDRPDVREFRRTRVTRDNWADFAGEIGMPAAHVIKRVNEMAVRIESAVVSLREDMRHTVADTPLLDTIVEDVTRRADAVRNNRPEPEMENHRPHVGQAPRM